VFDCCCFPIFIHYVLSILLLTHYVLTICWLCVVVYIMLLTISLLYIRCWLNVDYVLLSLFSCGFVDYQYSSTDDYLLSSISCWLYCSLCIMYWLFVDYVLFLWFVDYVVILEYALTMCWLVDVCILCWLVVLNAWFVDSVLNICGCHYLLTLFCELSMICWLCVDLCVAVIIC